MNRRQFLASQASRGARWGVMAAALSTLPAAPALAHLAGLKKSERMPVLFVGHGSPMNAIEDNAWHRAWQALGRDFGPGQRYPRPQAILCISAHFVTRGWWITAMDKPRTIHDFGGFPQALFDQQYPAPGAPAVAAEISQGIFTPRIGLDPGEWGLDHGTWSVLKPMFPQADIPVLQLSMDYDRPPAEHYALGRRLKALRERGVLVLGSGNIVHNLRAFRGPGQPYDWALEFDRVVGEQLEAGRLEALQDFQRLGALARQAHPTHEHYLPLLYAAGAVEAQDAPVFFNQGFQGQSISMRSVIWR